MRSLLRQFIVFIIYLLFFAIVLACFIYLAAQVPDIDLIVKEGERGSSDFLGNAARLNAIAIIILTLVLVCVSWRQLSGLNVTSKADFLLRIDSRYGSAEITKARGIIQKLHRKVNPDDIYIESGEYFSRMADEIDFIRRGNNRKSFYEFSHLLNFLDFLETLALLTRKNYISVKDIDELIGNSILYYYKIFKRWIYFRRERYNNKSYYCEFEDLVEKLESLQAREELAKSCLWMRIYIYLCSDD
jgi:hypothetical protein